jgi:hypothetical protein
MRASTRLLQIVLAVFATLLSSFSLAGYGPVYVPTPLQPWQQWVMHEQTTYPCPFSPQDYNARVCAWPTSLHLELENNGASFSQHWQVYQSGYLALPGGDKLWPQSVMVNGTPAAIVTKDQRPWVYADAGAVDIRGRFEWASAPDAVPLPPETALLTVSRNGQRMAFPNLDAEGRFWLKQPQTEEAQAPAQEEQITVRVYRRLSDNVPFEVETLVETEVSGKPREMVLGPALLPGYQLRAFDAQLPARLDEAGQLRVQLRAGLWQFRVTGHRMGAITRVEKPASVAPWPDDEIWVFTPQNALRTVRVENVDALDPQQTTLPEEWRQWQAYRLTSEKPLELAVIRRGDPEPAPNQLTLAKMLWLDFDGGGWTVKDDFNGQVNREWRMQGDGQMALGEVTINGQPQVITRLQQADNDGVEVRDAQLRLQAVSRIESEDAPRHWTLSVSGWQEDFQSMSARVHLPPGWRLLAASGVDNATPTWLGEWSVWDVFLLLIAVAAVGKVIGWGWSVVALVALGLVYPESPVLLFLVLNVVAAVALVRLLETGNLRVWVESYVRLSALVLVVATLPFVVQQVRLSIYPQLENPYTRISDSSRYEYEDSLGGVSTAADYASEAAVMAPSPAMSAVPAPMEMRVKKSVGLARESLRPATPLQQQIDPQQAAQTGPGLPRWRWQSAELRWSGPVAEGQTLGLWLVGPTENRVLAVLRVGSLALLVAALLGVGRSAGRWRWNPVFLRGGAVTGVLLALLLVGTSAPVQAAQEGGAGEGSGLPDASLLDRLQERLWGARDCTPDCLGIERVAVQIEGARLTLNLSVGALEDVEMLLPDSQGQWQPQTAVIDGTTALAMRKEDGRHLIVVPKGSQRMTLSGPLRERDSFQLSFSLPAHNVAVQAPGWTVQGIDQGQLQGGALLFSPDVIEKQKEESPTLAQAPAPAFVQINRSLRLGLTWQVITSVQRVAPTQGAIQLDVPLLAGESVITRDVVVNQGKVAVALKANQDSLEWVSNLEPVDQLTFTATDTALWSEYWTAEISPLWHVEFTGMDALKSPSSGQWQPAWQPYPGETLTLSIQKPTAKPGPTATIDQVTLVASPGTRESSYTLDVHVRTSKGGEQRLILPDGIHLTQVLLDGQPQASEETNPNVVLQVAPGEHDVSVAWRSNDAIASRWVTPVVSLSETLARNVDLTVNVPDSRWVLFVGGPAIGPAVLFWGMALVLIAVALVLGKLSMSPLRGWQWVLLVLGFSTGSWWGLTAVTLWFFALAWREKYGAALSENGFNLLQLGLITLSVCALVAFVVAIPEGLLGSPDMDIVGNASQSYQLNWYQDVMQQALPQAWVVSVPLWVYRALMLAWSLWIAVAMLKWLPWAWRAYSTGGYWRSQPRKPRPQVEKPGAEKPGVEKPVAEKSGAEKPDA